MTHLVNIGLFPLHLRFGSPPGCVTVMVDRFSNFWHTFTAVSRTIPHLPHTIGTGTYPVGRRWSIYWDSKVSIVFGIFLVSDVTVSKWLVQVGLILIWPWFWMSVTPCTLPHMSSKTLKYIGITTILYYSKVWRHFSGPLLTVTDRYWLLRNITKI